MHIKHNSQLKTLQSYVSKYQSIFCVHRKYPNFRRKFFPNFWGFSLLFLAFYSCKPQSDIFDRKVWKIYCKYVGYVVSGVGTDRASLITINTSTGGTAQFSNVRLPWAKTYGWFSDDFVYISAQNANNSGSITVKIYVLQDGIYAMGKDGSIANGRCNAIDEANRARLVEMSTSSGAYVIASASDYYPKKESQFQ